jgi:hypothetical protein
MKTTILAIILTCGCIIPSYSQINQKRKSERTTNYLSSFHYDLTPAPDYKKLPKPTGLWDDKTTEGFLSNNNQYTERTHEQAFVRDRMPCYKPAGVFSMRINKPDSTITYTMLIKKY